MGGERSFTAGLRALFAHGEGVPVGIGDDAAVVDNRGARSVLTVDPVVAGVHFDPAAAPRRIGAKAVLRAVSDLAAMGATADWLLVSAVLPRGYGAAARDELFAGLRDAADAIGSEVVGGDVAGTPGPLVVVVTAIGHLEGEALVRAAARVGDALYVSGPLGGALLDRHLEPVPRLEVGRWLATRTPVRAAIDVSDGLAIDLRTMLDAADCPGAVLDAATIPIHGDAQRAAAHDGRSALEHALHDGEDYELLFALREGELLPPGGPLGPAHRMPVGRIVAERGLWLRHPDGTLEPVEPAGYEHDV